MSNEEPNATEWHWPIDVTVYDRRSTLTDEEIKSLDSLKIKGLSVRSLKALERLLHPIDDALNTAGTSGAKRLLAVRLLMLEMQRRQQTFCGWSTEEWVETLNSDRTFYTLTYLRIRRLTRSLWPLPISSVTSETSIPLIGYAG